MCCPDAPGRGHMQHAGCAVQQHRGRCMPRVRRGCAEQMQEGRAHTGSMLHVPPRPLLFRREGFYMQQDADECWGNILTSLRDKLKASLRTSQLPCQRCQCRPRVIVAARGGEGVPSRRCRNSCNAQAECWLETAALFT